MSQAHASTELPEAPAWQLEFARLIAFPAEPAHSLGQSWWKELTSGQPEDYALTQMKNWQPARDFSGRPSFFGH